MIIKLKIKYINYGTGNRVGDTIYLNKDLKKYPKLHDAVLKHEKKHSGKFKWRDFWLDFENEDIAKVKNEWLNFLFKHPKAWANFLPVLKLGKYWCYDISLIAIYLLIILSIILAWYIT